MFKKVIIVIASLVLSLSQFAWGKSVEFRDTTITIKKVKQHANFGNSSTHSGDVLVSLSDNPTDFYVYPCPSCTPFTIASDFYGFYIPEYDPNMKSILAIILAAQLTNRKIQFGFESTELWSGDPEHTYYRIISVIML